MFEEIEMYRTKDGALFDCENKAADYITDKMSEELNEIIKGIDVRNCSHYDLYHFVMALTGTVENAQRLKKVLDTYL